MLDRTWDPRGEAENSCHAVLIPDCSILQSGMISSGESGDCATEKLGMLFVGRISKEKNLDTLVASTRRLAEWKSPARPLFIGDGPYLAEIKRLLPDALFTGYLRGEELAGAYASADFFVFPSTTDTFGNVVLEAQASGLPVIVSDVGGPRDLVQHGRDGLITKALDAASWPKRSGA